MDIGRARVEDADGGQHGVWRAALRPSGIAFLGADEELDAGGWRAARGGVDVWQDRVALWRARPAELLQDAGIAGFAGSVVAVDDGEARFAEGQPFAGSEGVDVGQTVKGAERHHGMARGGIADMAGVEWGALIEALADRGQLHDIRGFQFRLVTEAAQRVALPGWQIRGPLQDVCERRCFIRKIIFLLIHLCPPLATRPSVIGSTPA
ncbi:hypothetical protein [Caulobacter vibrioides]|uniref:hypothetical protein n=1 Tax=Caulobacter vibrioides TaxID=155892 RepID=UPI001F465ED7|nr:hypothetical protein [Caulobacter vibrioides]